LAILRLDDEVADRGLHVLDDLESLLALDVDNLHRSSATAFDASSMGKPVVLMGAGGLGLRALRGMRDYGAEPLAFCDNGEARQGSTLEGIPVLSPHEAAEQFGQSAAFVVTIWGANRPHRFGQSRQQLRALGCDVVLPFPPLFWKYPRKTLPFYLQDEPHHVLEQAESVRSAFDLWEDKASRREYVAQVRFRLLADFDGLPGPVSHSQYFPDDLYAWDPEAWILDGGAFDGDTIARLVERHGSAFHQVLACEPDPDNFQRLEARVAALDSTLRSRIHCRQVALASTPGTLHLQASGSASSSTQPEAGPGTVVVEAQTIDALVGPVAPTLLKLDIEGAEPDALMGAQKVIRDHGPILALCVYHQQDHLWKIPLMVRQWRDDYAFFLRPHNEEGWDLVCYAVPRSRLLDRG
jgi:FkbM family methyltransferase